MTKYKVTFTITYEEDREDREAAIEDAKDDLEHDLRQGLDYDEVFKVKVRRVRE
jgi:small-conductance mechanosensitive channel